jgi:type II secretion system protein C
LGRQGGAERRSGKSTVGGTATGVRVLAVLIGVGIGAVLTPHFWPQIKSLLHSAPAKRVADSPPAPAMAPVAPVAPMQRQSEDVTAGTESSVAKDPTPLVLVAVNPGRNLNEGTAALGMDPRNAQTYMAGAFLANGARLAEIHSDHVVLKMGQREAALYLHGTPNARAPVDNSLNPLLTVGGDVGGELPKPQFSSDAVSDYIRAIPHYRDGALVGFRVFPGSRSGPFRSWGLTSGDIVTAIDGAPLMDGDQVNRVLSSLAEGASLSATVRREGGNVTIALDGAHLLTANEARLASQPAPRTPP